MEYLDIFLERRIHIYLGQICNQINLNT